MSQISVSGVCEIMQKPVCILKDKYRYRHDVAPAKVIVTRFLQVKNDDLHLTLVRGHVAGSGVEEGVTATASTATTVETTHSNGPAPFCK